MGDKLNMDRKEKVFALINSEDYIPLKRHEICVVMGVPSQDKELFDKVLDELLKEGRIVESKKGKLMAPKALNMVSGIFMGNEKGFGFVKPDDEMEKDIFIPEVAVGKAMHKDRVMVTITSGSSESKRAEGQIVKIIEKETESIVGTFEKSKDFGFVVPDDKRIAHDIFIPKEKTRGAVTGHKVVVKITKRLEGTKKNPEGVIKEILGHIDDPGVDILSVMRQYDIPEMFEDEVYSQIENLSFDITQGEIDEREDFRNVVTITIDGDDSKDFDDAVSLDILENGNFNLGVHIADVSHYVRENSPLDKEAYSRGTSIYLLDRVIPMIPHKLSTGICSLNPDEDRLTLSCIMEIDESGDVVGHRVCESIIHSKARLTYSKVNKILEFEDAEIIKEYSAFVPMLKIMDRLRLILNKKREIRGSVNFDFPETKIILDEKGNVFDILPYERNNATNLIEEFMLLCNETVAEDYFWQGSPFIYRNHEAPSDEKIETMKQLLRTLGYRIKGQNEIHPKEIQSILNKVSDHNEEHVISRIILRSMKQAKYQPENYGHFGLAAKYYCHFTSPIRRYPDLQIHRIIKENLNNGLTQKLSEKYNGILSEVCKHSSNKERLAEEVERETNKLKKVEYMKAHIGKEFDGLVSGATGWGIYVELPNTVEGMIALNTLEDDFYKYDQLNYCVIGERTGKVYRLGDKVKVICIKADKETRTIDFKLAK